MSRKLKLPEVNEVSIVGRISRDPELKYHTRTPPQSGLAVCKFQIVVERERKSKTGAVTKKQMWINVICFGDTAVFVNEYLKTPNAVWVKGQLGLNIVEVKLKTISKLQIEAVSVQAMEKKEY